MAQKYWTAEDLKDYGFSPAEPETYSITTAEGRHSESVDYRFKSYALKMAIRVVCIICMVFSHGWLMWTFAAGAAILPWVAVVLANGQDRARNGNFSAYLSPEHQLQLEAAYAEREKRASDSARNNDAESVSDSGTDFTEPTEAEYIDGEIVEDDAHAGSFAIGTKN